MSGFARYRRQTVAAVLLLTGFFALWLLLSNGQGVPAGLIISLLATWLALKLRPATLRINPLALPSLFAFFLLELMSGAWAVARITLRRDCSLQPKWTFYRFSSADPRIHLLLSAMTGLLPGTLSSDVNDGTMRLHLLDGSSEWERTVRRLEQCLANLLSGPGPHRKEEH